MVVAQTTVSLATATHYHQRPYPEVVFTQLDVLAVQIMHRTTSLQAGVHRSIVIVFFGSAYTGNKTVTPLTLNITAGRPISTDLTYFGSLIVCTHDLVRTCYLHVCNSDKQSSKCHSKAKSTTTCSCDNS